MKAKLKTLALLPCGGGRKKNTRNQFGDSRSIISPQEPGFGLLVSEMPLPKVSRVLKLLSQSAVKVSSEAECVVGFVLVNTTPPLETPSQQTHTHSRPSASASPSKDSRSRRFHSEEELFSAFLNDCSFED